MSRSSQSISTGTRFPAHQLQHLPLDDFGRFPEFVPGLQRHGDHVHGRRGRRARRTGAADGCLQRRRTLSTTTWSPAAASRPSTKYYYAVSSIGPNGESTLNAYQSVTTSSAAVGNLAVILTWTANPQATGYRLYRSTAPITQASLSNDLIAVVSAGTTASFTDTGSVFTMQASMTAGSPVLFDLASINQLAPGMPVTGTNIPAGTFIQSVDEVAQTVTLSAPVSAGGTGVLTFNGNTSLTPPVQTQYTVSFNLNLSGTNARRTRLR